MWHVAPEDVLRSRGRLHNCDCDRRAEKRAENGLTARQLQYPLLVIQDANIEFRLQ